jgi:CRP/FNR family nitrogen fixation transcriptional regulator
MASIIATENALTKPTLVACGAQRALREAQMARPRALMSNVGAGQEVIGEGDPAESFYEIVSGVFRAVKLTPDGRRQVFAFYMPGDMFGLETEPFHAVTVEAVTPGLVALHGRDPLHRAVPRDPTIAGALFVAAARALEDATDHMMMIGRSSAEERLAWFLLKLARRFGVRQGQAVNCEIVMTRRDIADYLGLTIETVSRTMTLFKQRGLLALPSARQMQIRQMDVLKQLASADRDGAIQLPRAAA